MSDGANKRLSQVKRSGFSYEFDPEVKAAVEEQERKANALKVDSVQGMAGVGVNQRLAQRSVKAPVYNEDVLEGNGSYDIPKIDIPEGPGSLTQRFSKAPVYNEDVLDGNGSYDIPKIDIPEGPGSLSQMRSIPQTQVLY